MGRPGKIAASRQPHSGGPMSIAKVGSVELYYEEHGTGDPLLLIMGLAADSQAWMFQIPDFAKQFRVIAFDNRGVGRSSKPAGPYSIHEMADEAAALLDVLEIQKAHVVGVSMGGMIAQELVLRHPERVRALVLACTYSEPNADIERTRTFTVEQFGGSVDASGGIHVDLKALNPMMFLQQLLPNVFNQSFIEQELPKLMQVFSGALQYGFGMEAILGQVGAVMTHKATDRLHRIASPTLVITGDADRLVPPASSDVLAREIPGAKLVKIPGGSHGFNFETPEIFNREVLEFLKGAAA
ncbi:MAG: alpha/beta fold hydrolase [Deltaproteobacteria bacterium]|nr:alpha/beta fold hydrolase [Deltaproteobacteria bacterium]